MGKEEILNNWLDQCFETRSLHFDTIGKIHAAMDEYAQQQCLVGKLFRVTAKNTFPDPTIFLIKSINGNEVIVSWQDIHGRGERTTLYVLNDVKSKFKLGDWTEVNPLNELTEKDRAIAELREGLEEVMKTSDNALVHEDFDKIYDIAKSLLSKH